MIRTKAYILREISQLKKRKKQLEYEALTLSKAGNDIFKYTNEVLQKEIIEITGMIKGHQWVAFTNEKTLPKIKTKKEEKK